MPQASRVKEPAEHADHLNPLDPRDRRRVQLRLGYANIRDVHSDKWEHRILLLTRSQCAISWAQGNTTGWATLARSSTTFEPTIRNGFEPTYRILLRRPKSATGEVMTPQNDDYTREMSTLAHAFEKGQRALGTGFFHPLDEERLDQFFKKFTASRVTGCTLSTLERSWVIAQSMAVEQYTRAAARVVINKRTMQTGEPLVVLDVSGELTITDPPVEAPVEPPIEETPVEETPIEETPVEETPVEAPVEESEGTAEEKKEAEAIIETLFGGLQDMVKNLKPGDMANVGKDALAALKNSGRRQDVITETSPMEGGETVTVNPAPPTGGFEAVLDMFKRAEELKVARAAEETVVEVKTDPVIEALIETPVETPEVVETEPQAAPAVVEETPAVEETPTLVVMEGATLEAPPVEVKSDATFHRGKKGRRQ